MEKLQAALAKAREKRGATLGQGGALDGPGSTRLRSRVVDSDVAALWAELRPMEVDNVRLTRRRLVAATGGSHATPFDVLRTKVLQLTGPQGWRRVAVTSPSPGSGKTTTAANLALSLARQVDLRVTLMDMDMRRPALARALGNREALSVASILEGRTRFADEARRVGDNLAIAMNQGAARHASDLFLRDRSAKVLDEIEATYRPSLMVFDMPPMMVNDDTSAFLRHVDCVLIVAEAGISTVSQIDLCEKELAEQTNVLGVVLNKCRSDADGYGYYDYNSGY